MIRHLLADGTIAFTLPEKPNSRLQKYRLASASEPVPADNDRLNKQAEP